MAIAGNINAYGGTYTFLAPAANQSSTININAGGNAGTNAQINFQNNGTNEFGFQSAAGSPSSFAFQDITQSINPWSYTAISGLSNAFLSIPLTKASTSTGTGALTVAGGAGIGGNEWVGGYVATQGLATQSSTISTSGSTTTLTTTSSELCYTGLGNSIILTPGTLALGSSAGQIVNINHNGIGVVNISGQGADLINYQNNSGQPGYANYKIYNGQSVILQSNTINGWNIIGAFDAGTMFNGSRSSSYFDEFINISSYAWTGTVVAGGGGAAVVAGSVFGARPGVAYLSCNGNGAAYELATVENIFFPGVGYTILETSINFNTLTSTTGYSWQFGFMDAYSTTNGIYFEYYYGNSLNVQCLTMKASTVTRTTTTFAPTAGTWVKFRIEMNSAWTTAYFFINDICVATSTTNIPIVALYGTYTLAQISSAGGAATVYMDWYKHSIIFATPR